MLSVASGHDVGYLLGPVAGGRESYYSGAVAAGEPPGLWHGAGAELLGLSGEVDAEQMEAVYSHLLDPRDPATGSRDTWGEAARLGAAHKNYRSADQVYEAALEREPDAGPERRAELRAQAESAARAPVSFLDITFSAPKSISVLAVAFERMANDARAAGDEPAAAAWDAHHKAVEDAVLAGAQAAIDFLQDKAGYARIGHHGGNAGRWIDSPNFVTALFLQHDSRDGDPQLHVHGPTLNRVLCADGTWRALDSRAIYAWKAAAGAIAERVMEARLAATVGTPVATRPDGKAREVVGIGQDLRDLYSSRRHATTRKAEQLLAAFTVRHGRDPSALEHWHICQQATLATRQAKSHHGETRDQQLDRWAAECQAALLGGLTRVARDAVARAQQPGPAATWSQTDVIEQAMARLENTQGRWSYSQAMLAVSQSLPGLPDLDEHQVRPLLEGLTDRLIEQSQQLTTPEDTSDLPADYLLAGGASSFERPGSALYATGRQVAGIHALRRAAVERGAATVPAKRAAEIITRYAESGRELGADQAAAVRGVLTSGARVEVLCAAAGTGKTVVTGALTQAWQAHGGRVFGLAPSQVAAEVLAEEGVTSRNVTSWLGTQARLDKAGDAHQGDAGWRLAAGDLVIVDEAGMTDTGDLAAIHARCAAADAKLLLVGDHRQLAAVGTGGGLADVAERAARYELAEVRRFTEPWEGPASLALRDGDPAALEAYQRHGRLVDGGTADEAERVAGRAWLADTLAGRESVLLVGSNKAAARASAALRAELVALGRVAETGVELGRDGTVAGVGDLVAARRNGWELIGVGGNPRVPINRETYRVTAVSEDGGLTVAPVHGRDPVGAELLGAPLTLPASYVAADLSLGYACTVHAAQGRTVDTAHAVVTPGTDASAAYVALTRGRDRNTAYAVTVSMPPDAATGQAHQAPRRSARAVLAESLARAEVERSAVAEAEESAREARSTQTHGERLIAVVADATAGRTAADLDRLAADGVLSAADRARLAADDAMGVVEQLLRTAEIAGHDRVAVLRQAVAVRDFRHTRSPAQVLHRRLDAALAGQRTPTIAGYVDLIPPGLPADRQRYLTNRAEAADIRRRELGAYTAATCPQWAREALGPLPHDPVARAEWEHQAGWAASWRELAGYTDEADPLGPAPTAGMADKQALWRTAHDALGLPDRGGDEDELSDGQLRVRASAYRREEAWAPRYVGDELDATHQAAERHRADAEVWAARAAAATDDTERQQHQAQADAARVEARVLTARAADLEVADTARAAWYAATAGTRDAATRALGVLQARGVDLDDPDEQVTAGEWLAAHRAELAAEDEHRDITDDTELHDPAAEHDHASADAVDAAGPVLETAVPDVRDTSTPDATEHTDPAQRHRVPTADETTAAVARAQTALAEITARHEADAAREAEGTASRREDLTRWAEDDRTTEQPGPVRDADDTRELQR